MAKGYIVEVKSEGRDWELACPGVFPTLDEARAYVRSEEAKDHSINSLAARHSIAMRVWMAE